MKYRTTVFWGMVCGCLFIFLYTNYDFYFRYIEQFQVFPLTWQFFLSTVGEPAGLSRYLGGFILQFYGQPYAGALLTACLLTAVGRLTQAVFRPMAPGINWFLLALLPVLCLVMLHIDMNYRIQGTIAYLLMLICFLAYVNLERSSFRFWGGSVILFLLFWMAGPVMILFALSAILYEVLFRKPGWYLAFVLLGECAFVYYLCLYFPWQGELRMIVLPDYYYEPLLTSDTNRYLWGMLPIGILVAWWLRLKKDFVGGKGLCLFGLQLIPLFFFLYWIQIADNRILQKNMQQDYYLRTRQWDAIISGFSPDQANIQTMNVLNLALACKGELGDRLFNYPQIGGECLLPEWDSSLPMAIALADICYHMGDIASAQKFAFEGYVASVKGSPRLLQRLVQTNLIFGAYAVAEKYIRLLEQTLFYREWAHAQREFLYNDKTLNQDPELGGKRRALIHNDQYAVSESVVKTLELLAVNNPSNQIAIQYLTVYHLLRRDLKQYGELYEKYYRTKVWPSLSVSQQEAIVALEQDNPSCWPQKGVSLKVEQRYGAFSQDMTDKRSFVNFKDVMASGYGNTYWYYLVFKK